MVQALVDVSNKTNRIISIVKAKYGLKDKSQAIDKMAEEYELEVMEPELRQEFIEKLKKLESTAKFVKVKDFAKEFELS